MKCYSYIYFNDFCYVFCYVNLRMVYKWEFILFYSFLFSFYGCIGSMWKFQGEGLNRRCSCRPTPLPQQNRIQDASASYTTAHSNAGSLTRWARLGMEPASSWILIRFISPEPQQNSKKLYFVSELWHVMQIKL